MFKRGRRGGIYYRQDAAGGGGQQQQQQQQQQTQAGPIIPLTQQQATNDAAAQAAELERLRNENKTLKGAGEATAKKLKDLETTIVSPEYLEFLSSKTKGSKGGGQQQQQQQQQTQEIDFENLNNTQLAGTIVKLVVGEVNKIIAPLASKTEATDTRVQVQEAAKLYPDFWEYKDSMVELASRRPDLSPVDVYVMVKGAEQASGRSLKNARQQTQESDQDNGGQQQQSSQRQQTRNPVSTELSTGPGGGSHRETPSQTYSEEAGKQFDKIFGKGK
jgi:hypothetical protein